MNFATLNKPAVVVPDPFPPSKNVTPGFSRVHERRLFIAALDVVWPRLKEPIGVIER
jgi:hypothetical protein